MDDARKQEVLTQLLRLVPPGRPMKFFRYTKWNVFKIRVRNATVGKVRDWFVHREFRRALKAERAAQ